MPIQIALGTRVSTTIDASTRLNIVENLRTQLLAAGWTDVSGGSGDRKLVCVATPIGSLQYRVRLLDPTTGNSARVTVMNVTETATSSDFYLPFAVSKTYTLDANRHQFFLRGSATPVDFFGCGVPYLETFLDTGAPAITEAIWGQGSNSDDSGTQVTSFLTRVALESSQWAWQLLNTTHWGHGTSGQGSQRLVCFGRTDSNANPLLWAQSASALKTPARIMWGHTGPTVEAMIRGQLWDCVVLHDSTGTSKVFDGYNWVKITQSNVTDLSYPNLWVATTAV